MGTAHTSAQLSQQGLTYGCVHSHAVRYSDWQKSYVSPPHPTYIVGHPAEQSAPSVSGPGGTGARVREHGSAGYGGGVRRHEGVDPQVVEADSQGAHGVSVLASQVLQLDVKGLPGDMPPWHPCQPFAS